MLHQIASKLLCAPSQRKNFCKLLTPTFLNRSPTMFSADIRADGVSGEVPYPVWSGDVPMEAVVAWKSDVWLVVSGFNGDPSIFNGSLFSLLLSLSLLNSNPSPGFFLSFSFTASSCRRSVQKINISQPELLHRTPHIFVTLMTFCAACKTMKPFFFYLR